MGGPGWSDGHYTVPGERLNPNGACTDIVDEQFRTHDLAYEAAENAYAASAKTALDRTQYWAAIIAADTAVQTALLALVSPQSLSDELDGVATAAIDAFGAKNMAYNYPAYMNGRDPDDPFGNNALQPGLTSLDPYRKFDPSAVDPHTFLPKRVISPILGTTPDPLVKTIRYYTDPLILDLGGDGLEITPLSKGILFDANGDGIKTGTAWVAANDGMLVQKRGQARITILVAFLAPFSDQTEVERARLE